MANPVFVECLADTWTKVATNVVSGQLHKASKDPERYLQTYRQTGDVAPTLESEGVPAFVNSDTEEISAGEGIDVYIYAVSNTGNVRADL